MVDVIAYFEELKKHASEEQKKWKELDSLILALKSDKPQKIQSCSKTLDYLLKRCKDDSKENIILKEKVNKLEKEKFEINHQLTNLSIQNQQQEQKI